MKLLGLFIWVGLGGLGVSGMVPVFRLHHDELRIEFTYFIYFFFSVLMQIAVYCFRSLRRVKPMFLFSQLGFSSTLVAFGLYTVYAKGPWSGGAIYFLRAVEGLSMGLAMPLAFEMIVRADSKLKVAQKILYLNLANLLGFILGAPLFDLFMNGGREGWLFVLIASLVLGFSIFLHRQKYAEVNEAPVLIPSSQSRWKDRYFYNFLAKLFFGYLLTMIAVDASFIPFSIRMTPLVLALVFFTAQVILIQILRRVSLKRLEIPIVLLLSGALAFHLGSGSYIWILLAMGFQSMVQFIGLEKISETPQTAREFALINSMSDPGQILGAAICEIRFLPPQAWIILVALLPLFWQKNSTEVKSV